MSMSMSMIAIVKWNSLRHLDGNVHVIMESNFGSNPLSQNLLLFLEKTKSSTTIYYLIHLLNILYNVFRLNKIINFTNNII